MKFNKIAKKINRLATVMEEMSDEELQRQTALFKERLEQGENEQNILPEAFAVVREANRRVLGLFATDEQILGALMLSQGYISEIKTGEGKSLVATMPLYFKALTMKPAFLVTTNDYLARRDYLRIGDVYTWLGLRVADGTNNPDADEVDEFDVEKKQEIYSSDIIYISNGTLGFDFLLDGLAERSEDRFLSPLNYALLDEVDEILLDSAQQPLIISGGPKVQSNYFEISNAFVQILEEEKEYKYDAQENQVWLTEQGIERAKNYFSIENLLDTEFFKLYQHIILALKANYTLTKNKDYIIEEDKVKLVDRKDGRVLEGINLQSGLHQALEAKEGVELTPESQTISSITFQNLFRRFRQLSGMSGTAKVAEDEFINTYNLPVKKVRTHKRNIRKDHKAQKFVTFEAKLHSALEKIQVLHEKKRPILVITGSVDASEIFSLHLLDLGIPHNVLNAKSSIKEAQIIREAGQLGAITISTSMAGRGTDIKMTKESIEAGGLAVVITERMLNQRVELQAKGRAGRQGEPGDTYVFESLEDDVIKRYMQERIQGYYNRRRHSYKKVRNYSVSRVFLRAQKKAEEKAYSQRIQAVQFDEVLKLQKQKIDEARKQIMDLVSIEEALSVIQGNAKIVLESFFSNEENQNATSFQRFILDHIDYNFKPLDDFENLRTISSKIAFIQGHLQRNFQKKQHILNDDSVFLLFLKACMLKAVDTVWSYQVDALNQLRFLVQSRSIAQKQPLMEYEREAQKSYAYQQKQLASIMLRNSALSLLEIKKEKLIVTFP